MWREQSLSAIDRRTDFDLLVIGGGATGLGCALDGVTRGLKTVLLEASDFASGTSSRSTKLIHGGLRYLVKGEIGLVRENLLERDRLLRYCPDLVRRIEFLIPCNSRLTSACYSAGLGMYSVLSGNRSWTPFSYLRREQLQNVVPDINTKTFTSAASYFDAQFDDVQMALSLMLTSRNHGAQVLNHVRVCNVICTARNRFIVQAKDQLTGRMLSLETKAVVNATGPFVDQAELNPGSSQQSRVQGSRGVHIVVDRLSSLSDPALLIPSLKDGRVLFAIPWHGYTLVGTTDVPVANVEQEPCATQEEVAYLQMRSNSLWQPINQPYNIISVFAGHRPLLRSSDSRTTSQLSRRHKIDVSANRVVTVLGGKWTTYRIMAQDAVDAAISVAGIPHTESTTASLSLQASAPRSFDTDPAMLEYYVACLSARTVEDVLCRRLSGLFVDAERTVLLIPKIARGMGALLGWSDAAILRAEQDAAASSYSFLPQSYANSGGSIHH